MGIDMDDNQDKPLWLYPDTDLVMPLPALIVEVVMQDSKDGKSKFPLIKMESTGQKIFLSKYRADILACKIQFGKDSDNWKGKMVSITRDNKGKYVLTPMETPLK